MHLKEKCLLTFFHHFSMIQGGFSFLNGDVPLRVNQYMLNTNIRLPQKLTSSKQLLVGTIESVVT